MIDWADVQHFSPTEFVDKVELIDPKLITTLDFFRETLNRSIYPSPVPGSCVRINEAYKYSRHYARDRLSDAIDVFCEADPADVWRIALGCQLWGGIGVYFDTHFKDKPWTMFHLDMRPQSATGPIIWTRIGQTYLQPTKKISHLKVTFEYLQSSKI